MKKKTQTTRKIQLAKDTLRSLATADLGNVNGARQPTSTGPCTMTVCPGCDTW